MNALRVLCDVQLQQATTLQQRFTAIRDDAIAMTIHDEQLLTLLLSELERTKIDIGYLSIDISGVSGQQSLVLRLLISKGYAASVKDGCFIVRLPALITDQTNGLEKDLLALSEVTRHVNGMRQARILHETRQVATLICEANAAEHELLVALRIGIAERCQLFSDELLKKKYGLRFDFCYQAVGFERVGSLLQARGYQVTLYPTRLVPIFCFRTMHSVSVVEYEKKIIYKIT
jgi:hypothetical protein